MKKFVSFFLLIIIGLRLNAQEFKTDESIATQLKNNRQPGMRYAPVVTTTLQVKPHATMVEEIKKGKYGKIQTSSANVQTAPSSAGATDKKAELPSNVSAEQSRQELESSEKKSAVQSIPTQESGEPGSAPASISKAPKAATVKKEQQ